MYDAMLVDNESNAHAARRKYCAALASLPGGGDRAVLATETTKELDEYLNNYPGDVAAWHKMIETCLTSCIHEGVASTASRS